jgi:hypothetical protein
MHRRTLDSNNKITLDTFEDEESVIRNSKSKKALFSWIGVRDFIMSSRLQFRVVMAAPMSS